MDVPYSRQYCSKQYLSSGAASSINPTMILSGFLAFSNILLIVCAHRSPSNEQCLSETVVIHEQAMRRAQLTSKGRKRNKNAAVSCFYWRNWGLRTSVCCLFDWNPFMAVVNASARHGQAFFAVCDERHSHGHFSPILNHLYVIIDLSHPPSSTVRLGPTVVDKSEGSGSHKELPMQSLTLEVSTFGTFLHFVASHLLRSHCIHYKIFYTL